MRLIKKNDQGFSLLEVVITLAILVTIIFSVSALMRNTFDIKTSLSQKNRTTQRLNIVMQRLNDDINHAFVISSREERAQGNRRTIFISKKLSKGGDKLQMTYMGHQVKNAHSKESDLSYVVYEVKASEKFPHRSNLYRGELPRIPSSTYRFKEDPPMEIFVKNIQSITFEAWKGDDWSKDGWDSSKGDTADKLPHMLRITVSAWADDPIEGVDPDELDEAIVKYSTIAHLPYSLDFKELKSRNASFKMF